MVVVSRAEVRAEAVGLRLGVGCGVGLVRTAVTACIVCGQVVLTEVWVMLCKAPELACHRHRGAPDTTVKVIPSKLNTVTYN